MNPQNTPRGSRPKGIILVCVLVCLGVASMMMLSTIQASLRQRRQMNREWQMEQTRWLIHAGFTRAINRRGDSDNYQGEQWDVSEAFDRFDQSLVRIEVKELPGEQDRTQVTVTAEVHDSSHSHFATQQSETWLLRASDFRTNILPAKG